MGTPRGKGKPRYPLTGRQELFIERLMVHGNQARAARETGCPDRHARKLANEWLTNPKYWALQSELELRRAKRLVKHEHEADRVVAKLIQITNRCMQAEPVLDSEGNPTGEWKFDSRGAVQALTTQARILGMMGKDKGPAEYDPTVIILPGANQTIMVTNGATNGRNLPIAPAPALPDVSFLPHEETNGGVGGVSAVPTTDSEGGGRHDD